MDPAKLFATQPVLENVCENLTPEEANQLRISLNLDVLNCSVPISDPDGLIQELPFMDEEGVKAAQEIQNRGTNNTLIMAASHGVPDLISKLIQFGANIETTDENGNTLLMMAMHNNQEKVINLLLNPNLSVNVNAENKSGLTVLNLTIQKRWMQVIQYLLFRGANLEGGSNGVTPLMKAVIEEQPGTVRYLIRKGANVFATVNGQNLVDLAVQRSNLDLVKLFVEKGVDVNNVTSGNFTPLINSAARGNSKIVEYLVTHGADVNWTPPNGENALIWALRSKSLETIRVLLKHGADPSGITDPGDQILIQAAQAPTLPFQRFWKMVGY